MKKVKLLLIGIASMFMVETAKASQPDSAAIIKNQTDSVVKAYGQVLIPLLQEATGSTKVGVFSYNFLLSIVAIIAGFIAAGVYTSRKKKHDAQVLAELKTQSDHLKEIKDAAIKPK